VRRFAALGTILLTLGCACGRAPRDAPRALLLIVIDTLRGDRPGYAGYASAKTPTLDSLVAAGTVFADAMTPAPLTLPAVTSLLTGRLPYHHGVRDNDRFALDSTEVTLPERFLTAGFRTGAVLGSAVLAADRGLAQGFESYDDHFASPYPVYNRIHEPIADRLATSERRADRVTDLALAQAASFGDAPFFLLVHYFDPHMFYDPPPEFEALHPDRPYDGEISFVDSEIGRLIRRLNRKDALVVVVSDHGESLDEHGEPQHGFLLYQSTLHVPVIVAGPGVPAGLVRKDLVSLVDLEPTLGHVFDLPKDGKERDGRVLDWNRPETGETPQYAEAFHPLVSYGWAPLRAIRKGSLKLISGAGEEEHYDVVADPAEVHQLDEGGQRDELDRRLQQIAKQDDPEAVLNRALNRDPDRTVVLRGLGYLGGYVPQGSDAPAARPHPKVALPRWLRTQEAKSLSKEAYALLESEKPAEAIPLLTQALALDSTLADVWYLRGYAHTQSGDPAAARRDLRRSLELDPKHKGSSQEMDYLNRQGSRRKPSLRDTSLEHP